MVENFFLITYILIEEKGRVLAFEAVTKFLLSVRIKSGNNMVLNTAYKADVPDNLKLNT